MQSVSVTTYSFCLRGAYADLLDFTGFDTAAGVGSSSDSSESCQSQNIIHYYSNKMSYS